MAARKIIPFLLFWNLILSGCNLFANVPPNAAATLASIATPMSTETPLIVTATPFLDIVPAGYTLTPTPAPHFTPSATGTMTSTTTPTQTTHPTPEPTYATLRGEVNVEHVSCRYGPGPDYLYLYGMIQGANQDVIGRTDTGKWVLTRSHGDNKSCWVKTEFLNLNGDVMSLEMVYPDKYSLPQSDQGYLPPWDVAAIRSGDKVTISWKSEALRPGDEEGANSVLYIVETWVCQSGQLIFTPIGAYVPQVSVTDEAGCAEPSHGRVFFSEKHGYAGPSEIPWPQPTP